MRGRGWVLFLNPDKDRGRGEETQTLSEAGTGNVKTTPTPLPCLTLINRPTKVHLKCQIDHLHFEAKNSKAVEECSTDLKENDVKYGQNKESFAVLINIALFYSYIPKKN